MTFYGRDEPDLTDSQRFQVSEARRLLATWEAYRGGPDVSVTAERTLAEQVRNLLAIIDQAGPEPVPDVPMVCTECRKPVSRWGTTGPWEHDSEDDWAECLLGYNDPVRAMVEAGNEKIRSEEKLRGRDRDPAPLQREKPRSRFNRQYRGRDRTLRP